jgi:hypothetical protein
MDRTVDNLNACGSEFIRYAVEHPTHSHRLYHDLANEFAPTEVKGQA